MPKSSQSDIAAFWRGCTFYRHPVRVIEDYVFIIRRFHTLFNGGAQVMTKKRPGKRRVLKSSTRQTGKSNTKRDKARKAMPPGKRRSKSGRKYSEYRKNRTDKKGSRV